MPLQTLSIQNHANLGVDSWGRSKHAFKEIYSLAFLSSTYRWTCVDISNDYKGHFRNMGKFRKVIFKNRNHKQKVAFCVLKAAGHWRIFTRSEYFCFTKQYLLLSHIFLERVSKRRLELYQLAIKKIETVSVFVDIRTDLQHDQMHRYLFIMAISKVCLMLKVARVFNLKK